MYIQNPKCATGKRYTLAITATASITYCILGQTPPRHCRELLSIVQKVYACDDDSLHGIRILVVVSAFVGSCRDSKSEERNTSAKKKRGSC